MELEALCGIISGALVAPLVAIVDTAIFSNASGRASITNSFKESFSMAVKSPVSFIRSPSVLWIFAVYSSTYMVSNCSDRYARTHGLDVPSTVLIATSTANIQMSVLKDRAFSRMYGVVAPKPLPLISLACYATRDFMTVAASFTLVKPLAANMEGSFNVKADTAITVSQLFCPIFAQLFNTPIFLYGMDLYNRSTASKAERVQFIGKQYLKTYLSRVARIGPAFSFGGIANRWLRQKLIPPSNEPNEVNKRNIFNKNQ